MNLNQTATIIGILLLFFSVGQLRATSSSTCYIHTLASHNNKFFLRTIPFDGIHETPTGKTVVFTSDSTIVYEIPRYFEINLANELYLSDDGQTVLYAMNTEYTWDRIHYKCIEIYKRGKKIKEYSLADIFQCNNDVEDCALFYKDGIDSVKWIQKKRTVFYKNEATELEKLVSTQATYYSKDTILIFAKDGKTLLKIDLATGNLSKDKFTSIDINELKQLDKASLKTKSVTVDSYNPKMKNGKTLRASLAEYLNMAIHLQDVPNAQDADSYKCYYIDMEFFVDTSGKAEIVYIEEVEKISRKKIEKFMRNNLFDTSPIPQGADKWLLTGRVRLMNKDLKAAKRERQREIAREKIEYNKRIVADSVNGRYIPKNLEDCFFELNKILLPKDIEAMRKLKSRDGMIIHHLDLGMWLRNNWSIWGGSRIQQYMYKKGVEHPDSISGKILAFYYDWLHGEHTAWRQFEAKESK